MRRFHNPLFIQIRYHLQEITKLASFDSFGGQIVRFVPEWSIFTKDPRVLSTVSMGFKLEFLEQPFQSYPSPNSVMNKQLCDQEIGSLLQKGATVKAGGPGFISSIFLIPKKSGRCRRIINLKNLYRFLVEQPFKMEGFSTIRHTIRQREWLAKLDLKDACLTIPVFEGHRKFLQFFWKDTRYEFVALLFGLSSAPWAFTKFLRVVVSYLRKNGMRLIIYLDYILIAATSRQADKQWFTRLGQHWKP